MIQNTQRVATYIYLRNGIYYFQLRLKKDDERQGRFKSGLIRKSLKTGNYREAIMRARLLWLNYMTNKKTPNEVQDEIDAVAKKKADMFTRGKELYDGLQKLDPDDNNALDWFFGEKIGEFGNATYDREALQFYKEHIEKNKLIETAQVVTQPTSVLQSNKPRVRISEMVKQFIDNNQNSAKPWGISQLEKYQNELPFFCERMNDCYVDELTSTNIRTQYVNILHLRPLDPKKKKILLDKNGELLPFEQVVALTKQHKLKTLGIRTYKSKAILVKTFLKFLNNDDFIDAQVMKGFANLEDIKTPKLKRPSFNDDDLKKLFNQNEFFKGVYFKKYVWKHWIPIIALYSGSRINEICQLNVDDVIYDKLTKIWYFNIETEDDDEKSLKTDNSHRQVPIHKNLIKIGFLNYLESQKRKKEIKLFSELTHTREGWSKKVKRWFNGDGKNIGYIEQSGVSKFVSKKHTTKSFHSLRSTFINCGKQLNLHEGIMQELVGHANEQVSDVHNDYSDLYNLKNRKTVIDQIRYNIHIDKFKKWS